MRVSFVSIYDNHDISRWSGIPYFMARSVERVADEIDFVHARYSENMRPLADRLVQIPLSIKHAWYQKILRVEYLWAYDPIHVNHYALRTRKSFARLPKPDVVFGPGQCGQVPFAYLECSAPVVFWDDSTISLLLEHYPNYTNLCKESLQNADREQRLLLQTSRLAIYSSDWAAKSAIRDYDVNPEKVKVVPFGANVEQECSIEEIRNLVKRRSKNVCKLLFIGQDLVRKGVDIAIELTTKLNQLGLPADLVVAGAYLHSQSSNNRVKFVGFLDKGTPEGREYLKNLLQTSHFLVLPSRNDCSPIVLCEASAFGVPSICSSAGGISSIVLDGVNGHTFDLNCFVDRAAEYIFELFQNEQAYSELCMSSLNEFQTRLNWKTAARKIGALLRAI